VGTTSPSTIHLPTTEGEFEMFLESTSLAQIFNFVVSSHSETNAKLKKGADALSPATLLGTPGK